ncbi:PREDICTED: myeloid differentiation primary response protein MyD88 [Dinoponera quadriceps]|uniref:Myeloid differentiation primary response protein MyD88 n=1 Tax=Dinoponera quadriceps TaxID=609295 RepID=A0A6P3WR80_DINQU|nr:PREDICTED: myeloid differentiation primary response protein MyD88 [Dinoponera quadriceps]
MTMDLSTVPLVAISVGSKQVISTLLNPTKVLPSENGLPRDWRGLAYLLELSAEVMTLLSSHSNPTIYMLTILEQKEKNITIKDFYLMMEQISRWDIIDDIEDMFEKDAVKYLEEKQRAQISADMVEQNVDKEILTQGDVHRLKEGLETQYYDAFLLYADEDVSFASKMVEKLETEYQLKLCLKDRDLVAGITFEHEAVMKIINERCNRVLIIISPSFLISAANKFFLNYAQALSIDKQQRKIVPCLYKRCELPMQLKYMFILDYNRKGLYDFWGKLRDSIRALNSSVKCTQKTTELTNTLPNKCSDLPQVCQEAKEETSKNTQEKIENCVIKNMNDTKALHSSGTKRSKMLKWVKSTANWKTKQNKQNDHLIMDKLANLPSLDNLDSLNLTSDSTIDIYEKKKKKKNLFDKFTKKGQMRKIAVQT